MPTQNLMGASNALPQVLYSGPVPLTPAVLYTCPANTSVKIAAASLASTGVQVPTRLAIGRTGTTGTSTKGVGLSSGSTVAFDANLYFAASHVTPVSGVITAININVASGSGTITPVIGRMSADKSTFIIRATLSALTVATGANALTGLSIPIYAGEALAFKQGSGTISFYFAAGSGDNLFYANSTSGANTILVPAFAAGWTYTMSIANEATLLNYALAANDSIQVVEAAGHMLGPGDYVLGAAESLNGATLVLSGVVFS